MKKESLRRRDGHLRFFLLRKRLECVSILYLIIIISFYCGKVYNDIMICFKWLMLNRLEILYFLALFEIIRDFHLNYEVNQSEILNCSYFNAKSQIWWQKSLVALPCTLCRLSRCKLKVMLSSCFVGLRVLHSAIFLFQHFLVLSMIYESSEYNKLYH